MSCECKRSAATCLLLALAAAPLLAQVFSSEFVSDPVSEGWDSVLYYCDPEVWNEEGWYHQVLSLDACPPGPGGGQDTYRRSLVPFNGVATLFLEFRVETNGDRSEIPFGAPTVVVLGNNAGVHYHVTVARDMVKFLRGVDVPIRFVEIEPGVPHTYRIDLASGRYAFYIDGAPFDQEVAGGPFPAYESEVVWQGDSWYLACHNAWDYIRYGVIPGDASGDYDTDGAGTQVDFYFFHECLTNDRPGINGGPDSDAGPGCRFADFDSDSDTDLRDFAAFQNAFVEIQ